MTEIAEWEANLELKHKTELLQLRDMKNEETDIESKELQSIIKDPSVANTANGVKHDICNEGVNNAESNSEISGNVEGELVRSSKAQKRREKKERLDKERTERIRNAENSGHVSEKVRETIKVTEQLSQRGHNLFEVAADGNCLYSAISHQLQLQGQTLNVAALRKLTADQLRQNKNDYQPFACHPDSGDMLSDDQYEKYCHRIESTSDWGGQLEITALSKALRKPIEVIQADVVPVVTGSEFAVESNSPLLIAYHRHAYRLGEHYNSTVPSSKNSAPSNNGFDSDS